MLVEDQKQERVWRDYYLGVQALFYFAQGIAFGSLLFLTAFLGYLNVDNFGRILFQAVIWIPWYLKVFFGVISDNVPVKRYGRRKPYVLFAGVVGLIGWITIPLYTEFSMLLIVSGILASFGTGMSDATIDALAVEITPQRRRGLLQGLSWGFRGLGLGITAILAGVLADANSWLIVFSVPGILMSLSCFLVLLIKENPLPEDFVRISTQVYKSVFSNRNVKLCFIFNLFAASAVAIFALIQTLLEVGLGFDLVTVGIVFSAFSIGMFLGALIFGTLGDRFSVRTTLPVNSAIYAAVILSALIINLQDLNLAITFFFVVGLSSGGYQTTQLRINMDNTPVVASGTIFNLYNSIANLGMIAIGALAIAAFETLVGSYQISWQLSWVFLLIALIPGYYLTRTTDETEGQE
ncbi:MAG: MFS transporter [Candidatus Thorarchaeota archaeon]|jgi:MFS family permease